MKELLKQKKKRALTRDARGRASIILKRLKKEYPKTKIALNYGNNIQLLAAVMLSAQCTDKKVNEVTAILFKKYKTVSDYARADLKTFEKEIRQTGFYHTKTKNIIEAAKMIERDFGGRIPKTMEEITRLPGVARKTANIVLWHAHGVVSGIAVDTHVKRLARRLGLSEENNPDKIEHDLMALFPKKEWSGINLRLIDHGRAVCAAKKPGCEKCRLKDVCPSAFTF